MFTADNKLTYRRHIGESPVETTVGEFFKTNPTIHTTCAGYVLIHWTRDDGSQAETCAFQRSGFGRDSRRFLVSCSGTVLASSDQ